MKFKILIAEDEQDIREILSSIVQIIFMKYYPKINLEIIEAVDGKDAFEKAKKFSPNIIITDIMMPKMNGVEFIKKIRSLDNQTPIIAVTALSNEEDIKEIMLAGANNYIPKPINRYIFTAQLRSFADMYLRKHKKIDDTLNLFDKKLSKKVVFEINSKNDFKSLDNFFEQKGLKWDDKLKAVYEIEKNTTSPHTVVVEEDKDGMYITFVNVKVGDIEKILKKENVSYKSDENVVTIFIPLKDKKVNLNEKFVRYVLSEALNREKRLLKSDNMLNYVKKEELKNIINRLYEYVYDLGDLSKNEVLEVHLKIIKEFENLFEIIKKSGCFYTLKEVIKFLIDYLKGKRKFDLQSRMFISKMLFIFLETLKEWYEDVFESDEDLDIYTYNGDFVDILDTILYNEKGLA
ncbi:MAG: response regulator, partial [Nautiliaceae bacterium]